MLLKLQSHWKKKKFKHMKVISMFILLKQLFLWFCSPSSFLWFIIIRMILQKLVGCVFSYLFVLLSILFFTFLTFLSAYMPSFTWVTEILYACILLKLFLLFVVSQILFLQVITFGRIKFNKFSNKILMVFCRIHNKHCWLCFG